MAWTAPKLFAVGEHISAAQMNTYVRDNLDSLRHANDLLCILYRTATQSIPNADWTDITWQAADYDSSGATLYEALPSQYLAAPVAGWYSVCGVVEFAANANQTREVALSASSGGSQAPLCSSAALSAGTTRLSFADPVYLRTAGQSHAAIRVYQGSGGALNLQSGATATRVAWRFVGEG